MPEPLANIVEAGWAVALEPVAGQIARMGEFLREQVRSGKKYLPAGDLVLRAFQQPFDDVKVLIVGQDPYPTPGHPVGLAFSVAPTVKRLPGSLVNIFHEYSQDLGYPAPATGDLVRLMTFGQSEASLVELTMPADAPLAGEQVGSIEWPADAALVAILREGRVLVPQPEDPLQPGDELFFVTTEDVEDELERLFSAG